MPIYEYRSTGEGCEHCRDRFEIIHKLADEPLVSCPRCKSPVVRIPSRFRACSVETSEDVAAAERKLNDYEKEGMWSHAAELADKAGLEERARDDYKKAGYDM